MATESKLEEQNMAAWGSCDCSAEVDERRGLTAGVGTTISWRVALAAVLAMVERGCDIYVTETCPFSPFDVERLESAVRSIRERIEYRHLP